MWIDKTRNLDDQRIGQRGLPFWSKYCCCLWLENNLSRMNCSLLQKDLIHLQNVSRQTMQIFWINHTNHKRRFSISKFSSYELNKRTSAHGCVESHCLTTTFTKALDSQSWACERVCELENVKPWTANSAGVGRQAKREIAVFSYSISEARYSGDGVILLVGLRSLFARLPTPALLVVCSFLYVTLAVTLAHSLVSRLSPRTFEQKRDC